jgi:hypothetical protein
MYPPVHNSAAASATLIVAGAVTGEEVIACLTEVKSP